MPFNSGSRWGGFPRLTGSGGTQKRDCVISGWSANQRAAAEHVAMCAAVMIEGMFMWDTHTHTCAHTHTAFYEVGERASFLPFYIFSRNVCVALK